MGRFFSKATHRYERAFTSEGEVLHEKLRLSSRVGAALVAARRSQSDLSAAIEAVVPREESKPRSCRPGKNLVTSSSTRWRW